MQHHNGTQSRPGQIKTQAMDEAKVNCTLGIFVRTFHEYAIWRI